MNLGPAYRNTRCLYRVALRLPFAPVGCRGRGPRPSARSSACRTSSPGPAPAATCLCGIWCAEHRRTSVAEVAVRDRVGVLLEFARGTGVCDPAALQDRASVGYGES